MLSWGEGGCLGGRGNAVIPLIFYIHPTDTPLPSHIQCISTVTLAHNKQEREFVFEGGPQTLLLEAKVLAGGGGTK